MLQQQKEIQRLQKSAKKIWDQVGHYDQTSESSVSFSVEFFYSGCLTRQAL